MRHRTDIPVLPTTWPVLPNADTPFLVSCSESALRWIVRNRLFFFVAEETADALPPLPRLILCRTESRQRPERFRVTDTSVVGIDALARFGDTGELPRNRFFVRARLKPVGKAEFERLWSTPVERPLGRRPQPVLNRSDFLCSDEAMEVGTHWLQNPEPSDGHGSVLYSERIGRYLPAWLLDKCRGHRVGEPAHPFSASYPMNWRLLARPHPSFTFIDLFAGIGGFRIAMQNEGGKCVFASEIDKNAREVYLRNFGVLPFGDITTMETKQFVPRSFDILCAGFPCQAFSQAGHHGGFNDEKNRGMLYRQVVEIAAAHRPKAIFCENVRGLLSRTGVFPIIRRDIEAVGYNVLFAGILNSVNYGVAQNRERLYIVAVRRDIANRLRNRGIEFPNPPPPLPGTIRKTIGDIRDAGPVDKRYYIGESYLQTLIRHRNRHKDNADGHSGFGFIVRRDDEIAGTLMCGGMGRERNMLLDENQPDWADLPGNPRKGGINRRHFRFLTIRETAKLQGFPDYFEPSESMWVSFKQFGNSVTVSTIRAVARALLQYLRQDEEPRHEH